MNRIRKMSLLLALTLIDATNVLAQSGLAPAQPQPPSFTEVLAKMFPMFIGVFLIFYFLVARPQNQKMKAQETLLSSLKAGDLVMTSGGIIGKITSLADAYVMLEVAPNVKIRVEKSFVSRKEEPTTKTKNAA